MSSTTSGSSGAGSAAPGANSKRQQETDNTTNGTKPRSHAGDLRALPAALAPLTALPNWVLWRWQLVKNKAGEESWTKVPYQVNGYKARNNDCRTWSTYADVMAVVDQYDGIGFCLFNSGNIAFDIDCCRDPDTGELHPWAKDFVAQVGSYTEITISGTGLRIIGKGTGPKIHRKQPVIDDVTLESYRGAERYIVITGNPLPGAASEIINMDAAMDKVVDDLDAQNRGGGKRKRTRQQQPDDDEDELFRTIRDGGAQRHGPTRSDAMWFVVNEMLRRGYCGEAIIAVLLDGRNGIAAHVLDQAKPPAYAARQVREAAKLITFSMDEKKNVPYPPKVTFASPCSSSA